MWWTIRTYIWYACIIIGLGFAAALLPGYLNRVSIDVGYDHDCGEVDPGATYWLTQPPFRSGAVVAYRMGKNADAVSFGRLVAQPGEILTWKDGNLLVGGVPVKGWRPVEPHQRIQEIGPLRVPAGYVYVISDLHGRDSVALGPISMDAIVGGIRE